jgi:ribosomal protein S12 methylthiotransferase
MKTQKNKHIINIVTLGCSRNVVDSEFLMKQLEANDLQFIHDSDTEEAKTVIINTCGFIRDAKQESINTILQFAKAKQEGRINKLFVMGCLSEKYKEELKVNIHGVDGYFGTNDMISILNTLGANYKKNLIGERILTTPKHYAYLKISEGCDRSCAFCAIPFMRGKHKSKPIELIIKEAESLACKGVKELILIAQDLTYYGIDLYRKQKLPDLLKYISDIESIEWIRLHYAYPASFPKDIVSVMKERNNICKYLDIPFQHINNEILDSMKRCVNKKQIFELIEYLRNEIPGIALRTTLMVGYPGEGKKEFGELKEFVSRIKFDRLGVFTYSEEDDTWSALNLSDTVPENIKKKRADIIMKSQMHISKSLNNNKIGKLFKVIVDRREGANYVCRSEFDSPEVDNEVLVSQNSVRLNAGNFYTVKICAADDYDLYGEIVKFT